MVVYLIENTVNGKKYVGQTIRDLDARLKEHISSGTSIIHNAIQKYGWSNFKVSVLAQCSTQEELDEQEIRFISELNCIVPNGYNVAPGGNITAGFCKPEEIKAKLRAMNIGKNNPRYGDPCREASKIASSRKNSRPVKDLNTGIEYPSMSAAADAVGGKIAMISACANGSIKTAYGHRFVRL